MKIGFVFDDSLDRDDGVQQYIRTVATWLMKAGHEVRLLVGSTHQAGNLQPYVYSLARTISVRANRNRLAVPLLAKKALMREVLSKERFDVLHVQAPFSPLLAGRVIAAADHRCGIVATYHIVTAGRGGSLKLKLMRLLERKTLRRIDVCLAVSSAARESAQNYFYDDAQICPNVVDLERFRSQHVESRSAVLKLAYLGRLVDRKGCGPMLRSLNLLAKNHPEVDWTLEIAGDGPLKERLMRYCQRQELARRVRFLGYIDEAQKGRFLSRADIAIFPAIYGESFGIVLIEAMAAGTLTLGGNNEGYRTVLGGIDETLFNPLDPAELAERLQWLHDERSAWQNILKKQRERVKAFDIAFVGPRLLEHYRQAQARAGTCQRAS